MATGSSDGNDNFWPGYVDAISNLVLNLLFVVAILTIAVFLFAIELGRKQGSKVGALEQERGVPVKTTEMPKQQEKARLEDELKSLRKQLAALQADAAAKGIVLGEGRDALVSPPLMKPGPRDKNGKPDRVPAPTQSECAAPIGATLRPISGGGGDAATPPKRVEATEKQPEAEKEIEKLDFQGAAVIIDFNADAVTLTKNEALDARKALGPVAASGGARLEIKVKGSFSEARRLAFYRAMAVRNLLIEMNVPLEKIDVSIKELKSGGDSTKVYVRGLK